VGGAINNELLITYISTKELKKKTTKTLKTIHASR